jgi:hypothetical protein
MDQQIPDHLLSRFIGNSHIFLIAFSFQAGRLLPSQKLRHDKRRLDGLQI